MRVQAAYTMTELAEMMGWVDYASPPDDRRAARERVKRWLAAKNVDTVQVGDTGPRIVPLVAFKAAFPEVWASMLEMAGIGADETDEHEGT